MIQKIIKKNGKYYIQIIDEIEISQKQIIQNIEYMQAQLKEIEAIEHQQ
jgi:hypothetical protein